jgi:hypothetical protein
MIEASAPSTGRFSPVTSSVLAPPGIVMVAPQTLLRNAEGDAR